MECYIDQFRAICKSTVPYALYRISYFNAFQITKSLKYFCIDRLDRIILNRNRPDCISQLIICKTAIAYFGNRIISDLARNNEIDRICTGGSALQYG